MDTIKENKTGGSEVMCWSVHIKDVAKLQGVTTQRKSPQSSYFLIRLVLCFSEESDVLDESGLDVLVVHELAEYVKLLPQELIGKINLMGKKATNN